MFKNPYLNLPRDEISRTTIEIPKKRVALLRSFQPYSGVLQTTLSILLEKLCHELEQSNLQLGESSEYEHAISECRVIIGGRTPKQPSTGKKPAKSAKEAS